MAPQPSWSVAFQPITLAAMRSRIWSPKGQNCDKEFYTLWLYASAIKRSLRLGCGYWGIN